MGAVSFPGRTCDSVIYGGLLCCASTRPESFAQTPRSYYLPRAAVNLDGLVLRYYNTVFSDDLDAEVI